MWMERCGGWAWGANSDYQVGDGAITKRGTPVQITVTSPSSPSNNWIWVSAGAWHNAALKADGTLWV